MSPPGAARPHRVAPLALLAAVAWLLAALGALPGAGGSLALSAAAAPVHDDGSGAAPAPTRDDGSDVVLPGSASAVPPASVHAAPAPPAPPAPPGPPDAVSTPDASGPSDPSGAALIAAGEDVPPRAPVRASGRGPPVASLS